MSSALGSAMLRQTSPFSSTRASCSPDLLSNVIEAPAIPFACANFAAHRPPLPHMSASLPSALKYRIRKSPRALGTMSMSPSAPTDSLRLHSCFASSLASLPTTFSRSSMTMKSLPAPDIFANSRATSSSSGALRRVTLESVRKFYLDACGRGVGSVNESRRCPRCAPPPREQCSAPSPSLSMNARACTAFGRRHVPMT